MPRMLKMPSSGALSDKEVQMMKAKMPKASKMLPKRMPLKGRMKKMPLSPKRKMPKPMKPGDLYNQYKSRMKRLKPKPAIA